MFYWQMTKIPMYSIYKRIYICLENEANFLGTNSPSSIHILPATIKLMLQSHLDKKNVSERDQLMFPFPIILSIIIVHKYYLSVNTIYSQKSIYSIIPHVHRIGTTQTMGQNKHDDTNNWIE